MVPEMQAAERRTWNSKPSEDIRVTKGDGFDSEEPVVGSVVLVEVLSVV